MLISFIHQYLIFLGFLQKVIKKAELNYFHSQKHLGKVPTSTKLEREAMNLRKITDEVLFSNFLKEFEKMKDISKSQFKSYYTDAIKNSPPKNPTTSREYYQTEIDNPIHSNSSEENEEEEEKFESQFSEEDFS